MMALVRVPPEGKGGTRGALIGEGRTAEVFHWDDGQVIKLFRTGFAQHAVREAEKAKAVSITAMVMQLGQLPPGTPWLLRSVVPFV